MSRIALAIWVKTPGFTPAKTRLARTIGVDAADRFYRLCLSAVHEVVVSVVSSKLVTIVPIWAVAETEPAAHATWPGFETVCQGDGDLGVRLAHVYDALMARHDAVLFIGADAPQIEPAILESAALLLADGAADFVLGPADDGGFFVFGGRTPLPSAVWTSVTYSAASTLVELADNLQRHGTLRMISGSFDVDTIDDLRRLRADLAARVTLGDAQRALRDWLNAESH